MTIHSTLFKALVSAGLLATSAISNAAIINVTTTIDKPISYDTLEADCLEGKGPCSLRDAVELANQLAGTDTIKLPAGLYKLHKAGFDEDNNQTGDLDIRSNITLQGAGSKQTFIDGNLADRILDHHQGNLVISQVTLQHGELDQEQDDDYVKYHGGAIRSVSAGNIVIQNSVLQANKAAFGDAIHKIDGELMIQNSVIQNHSNDNENLVDAATISHSGSSFVMQNSVYQSNNGGMSIFAGNTEITGSMVTNNHLKGMLNAVMSLDCAEGYAGVFIKNTEISGNQSASILKLHSGKDYVCHVNIDGTVLRENLSRSVLEFNMNAYMSQDAEVSVTNSTIANNQLSLQVGDYDHYAPIMIDASNKSFNTFYFDRVAIVNNDYSDYSIIGAIGFSGASYGGSAQLTLVNSTISGNKAKQHMIYTYGNVGEPKITLANTTIADNQITFSAYGSLRAKAGEIKLVNSLLADTRNCYNSNNIVSLGNNLTTDYSCQLNQVTDLTGEDPKLLPLADNGGNTLTHALPFSSPAIDAGNNELGIDYDQRGKSRPYGGSVDIGAYERGFSRPVAIDPWFKNAE